MKQRGGRGSPVIDGLSTALNICERLGWTRVYSGHFGHHATGGSSDHSSFDPERGTVCTGRQGTPSPILRKGPEANTLPYIG